MPERFIDDLAVGILHKRDRYEFALRALGVDLTTWRIHTVLAIYPQGWTLSGLSDYLGYSRDLIRRRLALSRKHRTIGDSGGLIIQTPKGLKLFSKIHSEALNISAGQQVGFSKELINEMKKYGLPASAVDPATISFPANLPIDIVT